ncbi:hypothetical protein QCA50_012597 [Cerrena zonata]|uniref:Uncharacterized protein n=1 Tax=Cerrena zonata TaxID=2478898 RepID=A0AAW0G2W5_9APHY
MALRNSIDSGSECLSTACITIAYDMDTNSSQILAAVHIEPTLAIGKLHALPAPRSYQTGRQKIHFSNPRDWYGKDKPTVIGPKDISHVFLPNRETCRYIIDALAESTSEGCQSIFDPYRGGVRLPIYLARAFKLGYDLKRNQDTWEKRHGSIYNASLDKEWPRDDTTGIETAFLSCLWLSGLPGIQRRGESATNGFGGLRSNCWLTDTALACMLDVVRADYQQSKHWKSSTYTCNPDPGQAIISLDGPASTFYGRKKATRWDH